MNIKVIIRNPSITIPDRLKTDGQVLLDLTESESLSLYSNVFELNDINEIKISGALSFGIKETELNKLLFWNAYNPNRTCASDVTYDVDVIAECFVLDYKKLSYESYNDDTGEINVVLDFADDHWLTKIKKVNIKDLDYGGKFDFTYANITDNWANNFEYKDGKNPFYFPVAVYGTTTARNFSNGGSAITPHLYTMSCLRPWFSLKWLLKEGFCKAGWTLKTSLDETDLYSRIWCYLLNSEFYKTDVKEDRGRWLRFEVESGTNTDKYPMFDINSGNTNHDVNGNYTLGTMSNPPNIGSPKVSGYWWNPLGHTIEMLFSATLKIEAFTGGGTITIKFLTISKYTSGGNTQYTLNQEFDFPVSITNGETKTFTIEQSINVNYNEGVVIAVATEQPNHLMKFKAGAKFKGEMATGCYMTGDKIDFKLALDNYTIEDLFISFLQLINGKILTDNLTKTVYVYPELPTKTADGTEVEGYYIEAQDDMTKVIIQNSYRHESNRDGIDRYLELKFKDSTDPYIEKLNQAKTLHSKVIDYGFKNDRTKTLENKLFEPTADKKLSTALRHINGIDFITVPFITDTEENTLAYNIKPRIAISLGYVGQTATEPNTGVPVMPGKNVKWVFEKSDYLQGNNGQIQDNRTEVPTVTQRADYLIGTDGQRVHDMLAFGDGAFDLFYLFYFSYLNFVRNERANFLAYVEPEYFFADSFRKAKTFDYEGQAVRMLLTEINDFKVQEKIPSPLQMIPHTMTDKKFKCNCQYSKAVFYQPFNEVTYPEPDGYEITSVKIDGVEQLTGAVNLGTKNVIVKDSINYVTNIADAINSLGVEGLSAEYFVDKNESEPEKRVKIEMLSCLFYEIIIKSTGGTEFFRYANIGVNDWNSALSQWKYKYDGTGDSHIRYDAYDDEKINKIKNCV